MHKRVPHTLLNAKGFRKRVLAMLALDSSSFAMHTLQCGANSCPPFCCLRCVGVVLLYQCHLLSARVFPPSHVSLVRICPPSHLCYATPQNKRKQGIPDLEAAVPTQEALLGGIHVWRLHDHAEQLAAVR